jgi:hypothetical protein
MIFTPSFAIIIVGIIAVVAIIVAFGIAIVVVVSIIAVVSISNRDHPRCSVRRIIVFAPSQEFEIHSPTLTSLKWWPTGMYACTHALVFAQLIINGKNCGFNGFMVQLRY